MSTIHALTSELRQALDACGGLPLELTDPLTNKVYLLVEKAPTSYEEYVQQALDEGLADLDAGRVGPWDPERIKREGRERFAASKIQPTQS